jgi:spermidine synthase
MVRSPKAKIKSSPNTSRRHFTLIQICFFLSGLCGLIYEILWTRMTADIIGSAPFSISIILTVFMGGLGLGSYLAGKVVDRIGSSLSLVKVYGWLELTIGAYALLIPQLLHAVIPLQRFLYNEWYPHVILYNLLTFITCAAVFLLPVICMGATLPILCRFYIGQLAHLGTRAGRLYGLNTIGAALGAILCGFFLIDHLGITGTLAVTVVINAMIGLGCLLLGFKARIALADRTAGRRTSPETPPLPAADDRRQAHTAEMKAAWLIFAVSGFGSMACEVIWTRLLGLIVGPTTYSFTIVLATFITGLALGSMVFGYWADRTQSDVLKSLLFTQAAAAVLILIVSQLLGNSQFFFAKLIFTFKEQFGLLNFLKAVVLFLLMILPTFFFGATFPLVGKICTPSADGVGRAIGFAYMLNTIGAMCGPLVAGFLFIPILGKEWGLKTVAGLQILACLLVIGALLSRGRLRLSRLGGIAVPLMVGLVLCFFYPAWSHRQLSINKYQDFDKIRSSLIGAGWLESFLDGPTLLERTEKSELVFYGEGIGGFTTVVKFSDAMGNINFAMANSGKTDASSRNDMQTQTLLGHFPMLCHDRPQTVMVIGLASGITAGEVLHYPVERLDILEINERVVAASQLFTPWNNHVLSDPRTRLIVQDARAHLRLTDQAYDVIISEPSNPWMAGLAALFTREFFAQARQRLNAEGVFVQWMHAYQMNWETFALVGRTFAEVFPNNLLAVMNPSKPDGDYMLVGFKGQARFNAETAARQADHVQRSANIDLRDPRLLMRLVVSENLGALCGSGPLHTDCHPLLEFAAPKLMYRTERQILEKIQERGPQSLSAAARSFMRQMETDVNLQLDFAAYALSVFSPFRGMVDLTRANPSQRERFLGLLDNYCAANEVQYAIFADSDIRHRCASTQIDALRRNLDRLPDRSASLAYLGGLYALKGQMAEAIACFQEVLQIDPSVAASHNNLGVAYARLGNEEQALRHFAQAQQLDPTDAEAYYNEGLVLARAGRPQEAGRRYAEALRVRPGYADAHYQLGLTQAAQGRMPEAIDHFLASLQANPGNLRARNDLGVALAKSGRLNEAQTQFAEALRLNPLDPEVHNNLGITLARLGSPADAIGHFRKALEIRPDFEDARANLNWAETLRAAPAAGSPEPR